MPAEYANSADFDEGDALTFGVPKDVATYVSQQPSTARTEEEESVAAASSFKVAHLDDENSSVHSAAQPDTAGVAIEIKEDGSDSSEDSAPEFEFQANRGEKS